MMFSECIKETSKYASNVLCAVHYAQDFDAIIKGLIKDEIVFDNKAAEVDERAVLLAPDVRKVT